MAKMQLVMTADEEGYYLCDENGDNESDAADWGLPVEYNGVSYVAASDDGETVRLFRCSEVASDDFELVSEPEDEDEVEGDEEEEGVEIE